MINIDGNIGDVYVGSTKIAEAYVGSQLIYKAEILPANSYIQDGLTFHLDGIEKGADDGKWVDLIGGKKLTGGATSMNKCFSFSSTYLSNSTYLPANADYTVEVIYVQTSTNSQGSVIFCSSDASNTNYICVVRKGSNMLFLNKKNTYTLSNAANNTPIYISANMTRALYNGNVLSPNSSTDYWSGNKTTSIGRSLSSGVRYQFNGRVYSIRVYNRRLTEEEQRFNYAIDKKRFQI